MSFFIQKSSITDIITKQPVAVKKLFLYNLFVSLSLTIASNFAFMDRLFMRLHIDMGNLGMIKSIIFLLPAIIYQFCAPLLARLNRDKTVIAVSYLLRCIIPLLLPIAAIFRNDGKLLTYLSMILFPVGMLFATFANNTLMKMYRKVVPQKNFNTVVNIMNLCLGMPAMLMALPTAMLLDKFDYLDDRSYFIFYAVLQGATVLLELPAILCLRNINDGTKENISVEKAVKMSFAAPYRNKLLRSLILLSTTHNLAVGLGMAYITIYLLEVARISLTTISIFTLTMAMLLYMLFPVAGSLMDKYGHGKVFTFLAAAVFTGQLLFIFFWGQIWILPLFALLSWDGAASICGGLLIQGEYAASSALPKKEWLDSAIAAFSLCSNGGKFIGLLLASGLYSLIAQYSEGIPTILHRYYLLLLPFFFLPVIFSLSLSKQQQKLCSGSGSIR